MINNIKKQIVDRVKAQGMNLAGFEAKIGVSKGTVTSIINGRSNNPSIKLIILIAEGLGCPVDALIQEPIEYPNEEPLNFNLLNTCFNCIEGCIKNKGYKCNLNQLLHLLNEGYKFIKTKNSSTFEDKFIEWIIEKTLEPVDNTSSAKIYIKQKSL